MSDNSQSLNRINALKAEIASLEQAAVSELHARRASLVNELEHLDAEIGRITGKAPKSAKLRTRSGRSVSLQELKEILENAPEKTLNVRKEKLDFANIKTLANANPHLLKLAGKGPWPTVTLLK
jgi:hypothetical protein